MGKVVDLPSGSLGEDEESKKGKRKRRSMNESASAISSFSSSSSSILGSEKPIARMKASLAKKTIHSVESPSSGVLQIPAPSLSKPEVASKPKTQATTKHETKLSNDVEQLVVDDIWKNLDNGKIDIGYAVVGYGSNGRPILDHDIFITLLINYGYQIDHILAFIDDFNDMSQEDNEFPLIIMNSHTREIYESIEPLEDSIYNKFGKNP